MVRAAWLVPRGRRRVAGVAAVRASGPGFESLASGRDVPGAEHRRREPSPCRSSYRVAAEAFEQPTGRRECTRGYRPATRKMRVRISFGGISPSLPICSASSLTLHQIVTESCTSLQMSTGSVARSIARSLGCDAVSAASHRQLARVVGPAYRHHRQLSTQSRPALAAPPCTCAQPPARYYSSYPTQPVGQSFTRTETFGLLLHSRVEPL